MHPVVFGKGHAKEAGGSPAKQTFPIPFPPYFGMRPVLPLWFSFSWCLRILEIQTGTSRSAAMVGLGPFSSFSFSFGARAAR